MTPTTSPNPVTHPLRSIRFAGSTLGDCRHVCAFFSASDDEYRTLTPFIRDGIEIGDRAVNVVSGSREDHLARLRDAGIDTHSAQRNGQLDVRLSSDTYMRSGRFDQDSMLLVLQQALNEGRALGFQMTRVVAHAEHVLDDWRNGDDFLEYETRLNYVLPQYPDVVICTYDLARIRAGVAMDVLRTHPMVVIGGLLQENPFYVAPDALLQELRARRGARRSTRTQSV